MTVQDLRQRGLVHKVGESDRFSTQYADIGITFAVFDRLGHPSVALIGVQDDGLCNGTGLRSNYRNSQGNVPFSD